MFDFLANRFSGIFSRLTGQHKLSEKNINEILEKVKDSLLEADIPYDVVEQFTKEVSQEVIGQKVLHSLKPGEQFIKVVHDKLVAFLKGEKEESLTFKFPSTVMVIGLQGSGKTTSIAKLAYQVKKDYDKKPKILLASVDFYRPAAVDQLEILAEKVGVDFYRSSKTDPVDAALDIQSYAKQNGYGLLFLDTAGRLHIDNQLLKELQDITADIQPKYKLLVLDAMTGQESLHVARVFSESVGFDQALLSKMDSDARAGAAFAFKYKLKKPIAFVGIGEKIDELEQFRPERVATRMLGMGDIQTLIEKADEKIKKSEQESMNKAFTSGRLTLDDFAKQMDMMGRLGSLSSVMKFVPGMGQISPEMMQKGEEEMKRFKAIISSMTPKERAYHKILDKSRKQRIAKGSGSSVAQVNLLIDRFEKSQQFVKLFKKHGKGLGL